MVRAWIGLGSNLDNPLLQLQRAITALRELPDTELACVSPVYRNPALPLPDAPDEPQPDYFNAVAGIDTSLTPRTLLTALQQTENRQGRTRERRWGARTLDLDLLLFGDLELATPDLVIPHPGICQRRFVLQPLLDLAPLLRLPDGLPLTEALAACPASPLERVAFDAC